METVTACNGIGSRFGADRNKNNQNENIGQYAEKEEHSSFFRPYIPKDQNVFRHRSSVRKQHFGSFFSKKADEEYCPDSGFFI